MHTYTYDSARRLARDGATTIPSGVDDHVKSIARTYDDLGRVVTVTSYENNDGTGSVRNQVKYTYNYLGKVSQIDQDHADAVGSGSAHASAAFTYDVSTTSNIFNDDLRLVNVSSPLVASSGLEIWFGPDDSIHDRLSRPRYEALHEGVLQSGTQANTTWYEYNGVGRVVRFFTEATQTNVEMQWYDSNNYHRFDRFGRVVKQIWEQLSGSTLLDQQDYTYDFAGNRLSRDIPSGLYASNDRDEHYYYDRLQRLRNARRGTLSGGSLTGRNFERHWVLDHLGNWMEYQERDTDTGDTWDLDQTREHNDVNEVGTIGASTGANWLDPVHDAAGNMTEGPRPGSESSMNGKEQRYTYDAWNRMLKVEERTYASGSPGGWSDVLTNEYDGLNQRIRKDVAGGSGEDRDYYYNHQWQLISEAKDGAAYAIYHWHPFYVDALACRMRAADTHFFLHDANFNVTAAVEDSTNNVVERYAYSPYGEVTVLDANFAVDGDNVSDIDNQHLYTGRERDAETGLQLNRNRYYHPTLGRWVTRDPVGYADGANLYYAYFVPDSGDPFGTWSLPDFSEVVGVTVFGNIVLYRHPPAFKIGVFARVDAQISEGSCCCWDGSRGSYVRARGGAHIGIFAGGMRTQTHAAIPVIENLRECPADKVGVQFTVTARVVVRPFVGTCAWGWGTGWKCTGSLRATNMKADILNVQFTGGGTWDVVTTTCPSPPLPPLPPPVYRYPGGWQGSYPSLPVAIPKNGLGLPGF